MLLSDTQAELIEEILTGWQLTFITAEEAMLDLQEVLEGTHKLLQGK